MLLPTIFPIPISVCFFAIAITDVINSGRDVPIATITTPMINCDRPRSSAIPTAPVSYTHLTLPTIYSV